MTLRTIIFLLMTWTTKRTDRILSSQQTNRFSQDKTWVEDPEDMGDQADQEDLTEVDQINQCQVVQIHL